MNMRLPAATGAAVIRALQRKGFVIVRISGSHHRLVHPDDATRVVTVPVHLGKTLKKGTMRSILRQAGLTADELRALL